MNTEITTEMNPREREVQRLNRIRARLENLIPGVDLFPFREITTVITEVTKEYLTKPEMRDLVEQFRSSYRSSEPKLGFRQIGKNDYLCDTLTLTQKELAEQIIDKTLEYLRAQITLAPKS